MICLAHPFGSDSGADCTRTDAHTTGHVYKASWAPDGTHDDNTEDQ